MLDDRFQLNNVQTYLGRGNQLRQTLSWNPRKRVRNWFVGDHPEYPIAPIPMCFTHEAMQEVLRTVGARPPETGGKIFSRWEHMGVETVEYDKAGSEAAGGAIYSPDTKWGLERLEHHMNQPELRLWTGDVHSHPGHFGHPSGKSGKGLGDLGYVEEVFAQNEIMEYFFIPILTGTGTDEMTLHPWVCRRGTPVELMIAEVRICEKDEEFPVRVFNPAWESAHSESNVVEVTPLTEERPGEIEGSKVTAAPPDVTENTQEQSDIKIFPSIWLPEVAYAEGKNALFPRIYIPVSAPVEKCAGGGPEVKHPGC